MKFRAPSLRRALAAALPVIVAAACGGVSPLEGVQQSAQAGPEDGPALAVLVVIDQLRGDLLDRYDDLFTGGLRRLLDGGLYYPNTTHDHAMTTTAPGHATLSTGVHPTRHGIVGNNWWEYTERGESRNVYAVQDDESPILGDRSMAGRSPANFFRDGLADWLTAATPDARVVSVSRKDRAAIGMTSRARGEVYWIHPTRGRFVTSGYYHDEYPEWMRRFNEGPMATLYTDTVWTSGVPAGARTRTRPDTAVHEGDGVHTFFPHRLAEEASRTSEPAANQWRIATPLPDEAVAQAALTALRELRLGRRGVLDYLAVSFSQADAVGHGYGPRSREQLDNLLRLDGRLGRLMDGLDAEVGEGNWVMAFAADHGVVDIPEYAEPPVERVSAERQSAMFADVQRLINEGARGAELLNGILEVLEGYEEVADAIPAHEIYPQPADSFAALYANSFSRERFTSPLGRLGIEIRLQEGSFWGSGTPRGTTHGSPYYDDRWVPLIFYGAGVAAGLNPEPVATVDVAPTLAGLAGIPVPDDLDGRDLLEGG